MSSAAIQARMVGCENEMAQCQADILALEKKVEGQTDTYSNMTCFGFAKGRRDN